jgi:uncharacterized NAD-dependent epimerase/dehydratase family protein
MKIIIHHFDQNAHAMVRFSDHEIVAVYDERAKLNGKGVKELLNVDRDITITNNFDEALENEADILVTTGEGLYFTNPEKARDWETNVRKAIAKGINVYNMSKILYDDKTKELRQLAAENSVKFEEASDPKGFEQFMPFALKAREEGIKAPRIVFSGTSMNSGKITAMFVFKKVLEEMGKKVGVVGTEPCSIFIGADEQVIPEALPTMKGSPAIYGAIKKVDVEKRPDVILVGNQTGLRASVLDVKESRAGAVVAWQILLGSDPTKIVLCSKWKNVQEIRPHLELIRNSSPKAPVIANVINGFRCEREKLLEIISSTEKEFGMPCLDVFSTPEKLDSLAGLILE